MFPKQHQKTTVKSLFARTTQPPSVVLLPVMTVAVVLILEEEVLVAAIASEGDGGDAQTGEGVLESIPSCEGSLVSPGLTGAGCQYFALSRSNGVTHTLAPKGRIEGFRWPP